MKNPINLFNCLTNLKSVELSFIHVCMNFFSMQLTLSDWASRCTVIDKIYADGGVHKTVGYWVWNVMGWCRHLGFLLISASSRPHKYSEKSSGLRAGLWAHWEASVKTHQKKSWMVWGEPREAGVMEVEAWGMCNTDGHTEQSPLDKNRAVSTGLDNGRSFLTLARIMSRLMYLWSKEVERQGG